RLEIPAAYLIDACARMHPIGANLGYIGSPKAPGEICLDRELFSEIIGSTDTARKTREGMAVAGKMKVCAGSVRSIHRHVKPRDDVRLRIQREVLKAPAVPPRPTGNIQLADGLF